MEEIKLAINHDKLEQRGLSFETWGDMYLYVKSLVEYLESHNKNYNKEQWSRIQTLQEIMESIDYGV